MKHPTNTNSGAVALRNVHSGLFLQAKSQIFDATGARLDTPVCSVQVVLDPYDDIGNIRSSCAFTFENNILRNCDAISLVIEDMTEEGDLICDSNLICLLTHNLPERSRTSPCSRVAFIVTGIRGEETTDMKRRAKLSVFAPFIRYLNTPSSSQICTFFCRNRRRSSSRHR
jgi:hypothetical protein